MNNYTKITSYEEACKTVKHNPKHLPGVKNLPADMAKDLIARFKLMVIVKAINKLSKFKIDYTNSAQRKWYLWYWVKADKKRPSGFGFDPAITRYGNANTDVGARLCVGSEAEALHLDKHFQSLYIDMLL